MDARGGPGDSTEAGSIHVKSEKPLLGSRKLGVPFKVSPRVHRALSPGLTSLMVPFCRAAI